MRTQRNIMKGDEQMIQYCRYCGWCFAADDYRCSNHPRGLQPHWTREQINRPNSCPNFALSDLGDVDTGKPYSPRTERVIGPKKSQEKCEQMRMNI